MRFKTFSLALALAFGLAAGGCKNLESAAGDPGKLHVGIVFDIGGKDDRSFNAAAWQGVHGGPRKDFPDRAARRRAGRSRPRSSRRCAPSPSAATT